MTRKTKSSIKKNEKLRINENTKNNGFALKQLGTTVSTQNLLTDDSDNAVDDISSSITSPTPLPRYNKNKIKLKDTKLSAASCIINNSDSEAEIIPSNKTTIFFETTKNIPKPKPRKLKQQKTFNNDDFKDSFDSEKNELNNSSSASSDTYTISKEKNSASIYKKINNATFTKTKHENTSNEVSPASNKTFSISNSSKDITGLVKTGISNNKNLKTDNISQNNKNEIEIPIADIVIHENPEPKPSCSEKTINNYSRKNSVVSKNSTNTYTISDDDNDICVVSAHSISNSTEYLIVNETKNVKNKKVKKKSSTDENIIHQSINNEIPSLKQEQITDYNSDDNQSENSINWCSSAETEKKISVDLREIEHISKDKDTKLNENKIYSQNDEITTTDSERESIIQTIQKTNNNRRRKKNSKQKTEEIELKEFKKKSSYVEIDETSGIKSNEIKKDSSSKKESKSLSLKYEKVIGITIHKSDFIEMTSLIKHPMVKVHIIDLQTGEYLKKSDPNRSVCFYNENQTLDYITPLMTQDYNFKSKRSLIPQWEEMLIFNEDINYILRENNPVIIFFEILDFVTFQIANSQYKKYGANGGWHKIAWAFLKPVGRNGELNIDCKLRLQLYKPLKLRNKHTKCEVYNWWLKKIHHKYPSTLYVSVRGILPIKNDSKVLRSRMAFQEEYDDSIVETQTTESNEKNDIRTDVSKKSSHILQELNVNWSRLPGQTCKIPNKSFSKLRTTSQGCFSMKFSNNGRMLACVMIDTDRYFIYIYMIPSLKLYLKLRGHQGLIYAINWSNNDKYLLSTSSDCTVLIWNISKEKITPAHMLPHPSFVYCAEFSSISNLMIASGCYDFVVRIWRKNENTNSIDLMQELEKHEGFVSALCFSKSGSNLYSADQRGIIIHWKTFNDVFTFNREIKVNDIRNTTINNLILHNSERKLLVHARNNLLLMIDINTGFVLRYYHGALNYRVQSYCCISPCGNLLLSPSEDGLVNVWNIDTGVLLVTYNPYSTIKNHLDPTHCVQYHPFDNIIAISHYGKQLPICLFKYDETYLGKEPEIQIIHRNNEKVTNSNDTNTTLKSYPKVSFKESFPVEMNGKIHLKEVIEKMDKILLPLKNMKS